MKKTALSAVFYSLLAGLILLVLLTGGTAESGKLLQNTPEPGSSEVRPISPYEQARRIVGLALSECWEQMGENPRISSQTDPRDAWRATVTLQGYINCTMRNLQAWKLEEPAIEEVEAGIDPIK